MTLIRVKVKVKVDCSEEKTVWADTNGVELIIRNLLDNALKNSSFGGTVWIKAISEPASSHRVTVSIRDNGHGMEAQTPEMINAVFLHPETSPRRSQGLGLILISRFIKRNKGTIQVESVFNQGSIFTFSLPVWEGDRVPYSF